MLQNVSRSYTGNLRSHLVQNVMVLAMIFTTAPVNAEFGVVDQILEVKSPTRLVVSSTGDIFVTEHDVGRVTVFDNTGKKITTLDSFYEPLGVAIAEVARPEPPEPEPVTIALDCPKKIKKDKGELDERKADKKDACKWGFDTTMEIYPETEEEPSLWLPVIYVADEGNGSVQVVNNGSISTLGSGSGEFTKPNGIAVTADQTVYVVDSGVHQVKVYDSLGTLQSTFGSQGTGEGQLNFPIDIVINETLGEVYVTDFQNERIAVFNLAGGYLRNIQAPKNDGGDPAFMRPSGLGIDPAGNLYVVDNVLSCVVIIDGAGNLIDIIGYKNGRYWTGELSLPSDVAADGQRIYVTLNKEGMVKVLEEVAP